MPKILAVDDDPQILDVVSESLSRFGYDISCVGDAASAKLELRRFEPDLILLDIVLPDTSGIDFCRELRQTRDVPVIFLSGLDTEVDRIVGLEIGADDYLTKPFHPGELLARVKAVLRRTSPKPLQAVSNSNVLEHGEMRMDLDGHQLTVSGEPVDLTKTEFLLLKTMMRHPNKVYTRDELTASAHGPMTHVSDRTVNSHIRRLRAKLEEVGIDPIETVRGVGYRIAASDS